MAAEEWVQTGKTGISSLSRFLFRNAEGPAWAFFHLRYDLFGTGLAHVDPGFSARVENLSQSPHAVTRMDAERWLPGYCYFLIAVVNCFFRHTAFFNRNLIRKVHQ